MNPAAGKVVSIVAASAAVIVAAWATMRVMDDVRDQSRAKADLAEAQAERAKQAADMQISQEKTAAHQIELERLRKETAETEAVKAKELAIANQAAAERAKAEQAKAAEENETKLAVAKAAAAQAADEARAAEAKADAEKQETTRVRLQAKADEKAAADKIRLTEVENERLRIQNERVVAEAKIIEARQLDLDARERQILAAAAEVEAQRQALRDEKEMTIKDLVTTGAEEGARQAEGPVLKENDPTIPRESRALARAERLQTEQDREQFARNRAATVSRLEGLYLEAIRDDRIADANFYHRELKRLYPDWEYKPKKEEAKQ